MFFVAVVWALLSVGVNAQPSLRGLPNDRPNSTRFNSTTSFPPQPQDCATGENWTTCWSSTCWEKQCGIPLTKICTKDCKVGCRCQDGWARNGSRCIPEASCPNATVTGAIGDRSLSLGALTGIAGGAITAISNVFNQTAQSCGLHEVWVACASSSCFEHRCDTKPSILCTRDCRSGCKCMDGFARIDTQCVNETQCVTYRSGKVGKGKLRSIVPTLAPSGTSASAAPTAAPTAASEVMFVGPFKQRCDGGDASSQCLVTKSVSATQFSSNLVSIDGFDFQPGFDYRLRVRPQRVKAGQIKYTLVSIASQTPAKTTAAPSSSSSTTSSSISSVASFAASTSSNCAEVACMVFCDFGYKKNAQGCEICSCLPAPTALKVCPDVTCDNLCPSGYQKNTAGCATCSCAPIATAASLTTTTLNPPVAYNCNSALDWTLAKVAACCVPLPPAGTPANNLCKTGFQSGFVSLPVN